MAVKQKKGKCKKLPTETLGGFSSSAPLEPLYSASKPLVTRQLRTWLIMKTKTCLVFKAEPLSTAPIEVAGVRDLSTKMEHAGDVNPGNQLSFFRFV